MSAPTILVTGATGKTGAAVVAQLRDEDATVRALVHRRDERSEQLSALGAEVAVADLFDPLQVRAALGGIDRVYYVAPWHPHMLHSAVILATEARRARVEAIVALSQWLASPSHPSLATRQSWLVEQLLGLVPDAAHVTVNPGFFADSYLRGLIGFASQLGIFPFPGTKGRNAPPSDEDIARVAVGALLDPESHAGRRYRPTGPELLSLGEMADVLSDVLGHKVRHVPVPIWMMLRAVRVMGPRMGLDDYLMSGLRYYLQEQALGTWEVGAPTTHVRDISGRDAEDFATIARRYAQLPQAQPSLANRARALLDFMRIPVTPTPRLDRLARSQQHPLPAAPQLSGASDEWAREHDCERRSKARAPVSRWDSP